MKRYQLFIDGDFDDMKRSGIGRENGIETVSEFLETKSVFISTAANAPANAFVMR